MPARDLVVEDLDGALVVASEEDDMVLPEREEAVVIGMSDEE